MTTMEITPLQNGIHSLAESLKAFKKSNEDNTDIYAIKDAILRTHHALETIFKHYLYCINPVFIIDGNKNVKQIVKEFTSVVKGDTSTLYDEFYTIGLTKTINILRDLKLMSEIGDREYHSYISAIDELKKYRDKLQHFSITTNFDIIARILGNVIPLSLKIFDLISKNIFSIDMRMNVNYSKISYSYIESELKTLYEDSFEVVELLRTEYNKLVIEAIDFFKGKRLEEKLKITITDNGLVGAPPYYPDIKSEGFLNIKYDFRKLIELKTRAISELGIWDIELPYEGYIKIDKPEYIDESDPVYSMVNLKIIYEGNIRLEKIINEIIIPEAEEHLSVLKNTNINIIISLNCVIKLLKNPVHFIIEEIMDIEGLIDVTLQSLPKGYEKMEQKIRGKYSSNLNIENTDLDFHGWIEPDGSLKDMYSLKLFIDTKNSLEFNK